MINLRVLWYSQELKSYFSKKYCRNLKWTNLSSKCPFFLIFPKFYREKTLFLIRYVFQSTLHSFWREWIGRRHGELHQTATLRVVCRATSIRQRRITITQKLRRKGYEEVMRRWFDTRWFSWSLFELKLFTRQSYKHLTSW